ncbi:hypothetical protein DL771_007240 [Monosporascus sp. 5C6A]|nr:hypothetical protein DL771_007240 [Monosporascus sp. 5C6A]
MERDLVPIVIGIIGNGGLIGVAAFQGDYYGVANAIAMLVSVLVRRRMMYEKRRCLNDRIQKKEEERQEHQTATAGHLLRRKEKDEEMVKVIITTPDDKAAVFRVQRCFLPYIVMDLVIPAKAHIRRHLYRATRAVGWLAFAIHVVCIGQAYLLSQLLSVGILVSATISTILGLGRESEEAGGRLRIRLGKVAGTRRDVLLMLGPTAKEEAVLREYWQLPHRMEDVETKASASEFWQYWDTRIVKERLKRERTTSETSYEGV